MEFPLGSRDVLCQAVGYEYISPNEPGHNGGFWPMQPLKTYNAYARILEFKKTPDQPELKLTLLPEGDGRFSIEAHNPTDKDLAARIRTATEFSLIPPFTKQATIKAGTSKIIGVK